MGIQILGIRTSASGSMLDFRYRVLDPDRARPLGNPGINRFLIDQASGAKLITPRPPKMGQLDPRMRRISKPKANQMYSVLFTNTGRIVQPGNKVTVVIGTLQSDLTVEEAGVW